MLNRPNINQPGGFELDAADHDKRLSEQTRRKALKKATKEERMAQQELDVQLARERGDLPSTTCKHCKGMHWSQDCPTPTKAQGAQKLKAPAGSLEQEPKISGTQCKHRRDSSSNIPLSKK
ncbi:hypothetical protein GMDG_03458 [Pseudogymnoascus destructans 20631-21]|uniref:Uncharacterized protein n=2 Tax=Pseudogymnoascus destructans TaxID=655981 RepID=L8G6A2_PSED2|nr:hypothetical protein GMDG_03458 [Pseudogymnoascus destructans 20631-21]